MHFKYLAVGAFAVAAAAQNATQNLTALLRSTPDVSNLTTYVSLFPQLLSQLGSAQNITILAPSNAAFTKFLNTTAGSNAIKANDTNLIQAILSYHVLNGTRSASSISNTTFFPTFLTNRQYSNVTGGQVVSGQKSGNNVSFTSGLKRISNVTKADVNFTGGVVHIIDTVLSVPANVTSTALATNLTALYGAVNASGLIDTVNNSPDLTIFAPNNAAFQSIGSALGNLTKSQIAGILSYHVVSGTVGYSTKLTNGTSLNTLAGPNVTITKSGNDVYVNSAKVLVADVLVANGVIHVIDNVLNPNATSAKPVTTATRQTPAFSGATSVSNIPLTSGQPTAGTVAGLDGRPTAASTAAGGAASSTSKAAAAPMKTGAMGVAALFGAGAAYMAV